MQGRNADALRWWNSSIALGRNLQNTSDTLIGRLVGIAIEAIGASPAWQWRLDRTTGATGGPLTGGRLWYGRDHAFYVSQVGEDKDAEVRDSLVRGKLYVQLMRGETEGAMERFVSGPEMRGVTLVTLGGIAALFGGLCLLLLVPFGIWQRKEADTATSLGLLGQTGLAVAPFVPAAVAAAITTGVIGGHPESATSGAVATACVLMVPLVWFGLPAVVAARTRTPGASLGAAFRGVDRRVLPATAALCALAFLALNLAALKPRAEWVRRWSDPEMTEMAQVRQRLGAKWEKPDIPKDAWRAEYPKLKTD